MIKKSFLTGLFICLLFFVYGQSKSLPIIGISGTPGNGTSSSVPNTYVLSVLRAGGVPVILPINDNPAVLEKMISSIDALIMTGGEDIDPLENYGEEPVRALGEVVPARDAFDKALIKLAIQHKIPVLAVCRGQQMLNVAMGGTLYQDIPSQLRHSNVKHYQDIPGKYCTHSIIIEKESLLAKLLQTESTTVNSFHHQSIKDLAPGLKVTARAKDGVIEAVEIEGNPQVIAIQFHPEGPTSAGYDTFLPIFRYLIEEAGK